MKLRLSNRRATRKKRPTKRRMKKRTRRKTTRRLPTRNPATRNRTNRKRKRRTKRNPSLSSRFKSIWTASARADRYWRDARADAVQIDLNRLDRLGFLFVLLFLFLFVRFLVAGFRVGSLLVVFLLVLFFILLFVGRFFLLALRFQRRSFVGFQRYGENAVGGVVIEALIELPDARIKVARGNEIEILPVIVEDGIVVAIEAGRNFGDFLRAQRIKEDIVGAAAVRLGIGKPQAVRRPTAVEDIAVVGLVDQGRLFVVEADDPELMQLVPVKQLLAVWRPDRPVAVDAPIVGDARFLPAHLRTRVDLELTGLVGKIRDPLSIG